MRCPLAVSSEPTHTRCLRLVWVFGLLVSCGSGASSPSAAPAQDQDAGVDVAQEGGTGAADTASAPSCAATDPRAVPVTVAVEPAAGEVPLATLITEAKTSIRVMVYMLGHGATLDALLQRASAGVDEQVILDQSQASYNQAAHDALAAAGAQVQWSDPQFPYMHAKIVVVDEARAAVSTGNFAQSMMQEERNYIAFDDDPADVLSLTRLFDADWTRTAPDVSCTRLLVSPVNARDRILALIQGAQTSLLVESMEMADTDVRNALAVRKQQGLAVRVLLASPGWISSNKGAATFLESTGVDVRYMATPAVHVKAIVADGTLAYLGSQNFSMTSLDSNREVGLIATESDVVQTMSDTFEADWAGATSF